MLDTLCTTPINNNKRLSAHQTNIINASEGKAMLLYFTKIHSLTDVIIKPIEYC